MNAIPLNKCNLPFCQQQEAAEPTCAGILTVSVRNEIINAESRLGVKGPAPEATKDIYYFSTNQAKSYLKKVIAAFTDKVEKLIYEDPLTGLLNKRAYQRDRVKMFVQACKDQEPISVLSFDLDKFKSYNDSFGHDAGDVALQHYGRVVKETLGEAGKAYRVGGEELRAIVVGKSSEETSDIAENIRKELAMQSENLEKSRVLRRILTVSIGISSFKPQDTDKNAGELLKKDSVNGFRELFERSFATIEKLSDQALYTAKARGRDQVVVKSPENN